MLLCLHICFTSKLPATKGVPLCDKEVTAYRRLIGRLIYLTNTRLDISFSVNHLSQFVSKPTSEHHQVAMHVLRYLKNALGIGIIFYSQTPIQLKAYSVSDWTTCPETRKSTTEFLFIWKNLLCLGNPRNNKYQEFHLKLSIVP